jgi:putative oxidoreductase
LTASPQAALTGLRIVVAVLMFIHGVARVVAGGVDPFGAWLSSIGFPLGRPLAWLITIIEIMGTPALAAGILVRPLSVYFAAQLAMGILLVHRPEGWFVVGLGRNGMEYSVLLIAVFLALAWASDSRGRQERVDGLTGQRG